MDRSASISLEPTPTRVANASSIRRRAGAVLR
jgi:hypothetical protein